MASLVASAVFRDRFLHPAPDRILHPANFLKDFRLCFPYVTDTYIRFLSSVFSCTLALNLFTVRVPESHQLLMVHTPWGGSLIPNRCWVGVTLGHDRFRQMFDRLSIDICSVDFR